MGVFYIGGREGRCGVFRRLCVGKILGWDFYWFGIGRGCDVFLWGGKVRKGESLRGSLVVMELLTSSGSRHLAKYCADSSSECSLTFSTFASA